MTAVPPPADEQACICPRKAVGSVRHSECPVHGFEAARAAADELDKYIAHTMDCESVMLEGYPCICGSTAAVAAYSRTQTEAVLERLKSKATASYTVDGQYNKERTVSLTAIDVEIARLRGEA